MTTTSDNVVVTIKFAEDGTTGRYVGAIAGTDTKPFSSANTPNTGAITDQVNKASTTTSKTVVTASLTLPTAGTYSIGGSGAIYVTEISLSM